MEADPPQRLFKAAVSPLIKPAYTRNQYVVTAGGDRFLINQPVGKSSLSIITVEVGWTEALKNPPGS